MLNYDSMGIPTTIDWKRIRKLFTIGLCAGIMVLIGDMLLGWGVADEALTGLERKLSAYLELSDGRIFFSAVLGLIGIPLEGLCYFGIYRLIAPYSQHYAHMFRSGVLGVLAFGGCGVHVPCLACVYFYRAMRAVSPETATDAALRFGLFFLLPAAILFILFFLVMCAAQISAFAKGLTPYPKWCWIFSLPVGMLCAILFKLAGNHAWVNAITTGWISIGDIWMFGGLLVAMRKLGLDQSA
ncbi:MAG: hypothetical protein IJ234_07200 [Clostridia bacterium]|nr:hypothetical protein [Clostridia bacterium]